MLLEFVAAAVEGSRSELRAELEIANQVNADLILESERQALIAENLTAALETVHAEKAEVSGRLAQVEAERDAARQEATTERAGAESARTELAKALLRLEAMPRLEKDLEEARRESEAARTARVAAEQSAAVAAARQEAAIEARQVAERALELYHWTEVVTRHRGRAAKTIKALLERSQWFGDSLAKLS